MVYIPPVLQWFLIITVVLIIIFVIYSSIRERMNVRYAILWITWALFLLWIVIWPSTAYKVSVALGIQTFTTFLFLVMIGILFMFNYYLYLKASKLEKEIKKLNYEVALLKQPHKQEVEQVETKDE